MSATPTVEELLAENAALTKALTGLTCGGSEFFVRKDGRFVADIAACVTYVRRRQEDAHRGTVKDRTVIAFMAEALRQIAHKAPAMTAKKRTYRGGFDAAHAWAGHIAEAAMAQAMRADGASTRQEPDASPASGMNEQCKS